MVVVAMLYMLVNFFRSLLWLSAGWANVPVQRFMQFLLQAHRTISKVV